MQPNPTDGTLSGVRVLELGSLIAGPFAGRLLGDMGADVIKIEAPDRPDPLRDWGRGQYQGRSLWWPVQSRNKRCCTLNLRHPRGVELLLELARTADAIIENFRPGTLERWGLGPEELWEANPRLIIARVSGYGQTGPYASRPGFASVAEAMGGLRYLNGYPDEPPPRIHLSLGDSLGAMFAVHGVLAALYQRDVLGGQRGQIVDVSLMESCFALLESTAPEYDRLGLIRGPGGTKLEGIAPSNIFRSADGDWIVIAANADAVFRRLCECIDRPELADDPRFSTHVARATNQVELDDLIAIWAEKRSTADVCTVLIDGGVVCGPIYTIADIFDDPQFRARGALVEHHDDELGAFMGPGLIPRFETTPGRVKWSGPWEEGSHNAEVYGELLGLSSTELDELRASGVL